MLLGIARGSFVTVSGFRRYLIMFDFGHRCLQLCNDVWMLRIEQFSGRSGAPEGPRCFAHLCAEQSMPSFHNVFRLLSRLVDARQCCYILDSVVENCSTVLTGARGFFLSMQFGAALFISILVVIGIAQCCVIMDRGDQCRWALAVVYSAIFGAQRCFMLIIFSS